MIKKYDLPDEPKCSAKEFAKFTLKKSLESSYYWNEDQEAEYAKMTERERLEVQAQIDKLRARMLKILGE